MVRLHADRDVAGPLFVISPLLQYTDAEIKIDAADAALCFCRRRRVQGTGRPPWVVVDLTDSAIILKERVL
jgi:hypothetical protein